MRYHRNFILLFLLNLFLGSNETIHCAAFYSSQTSSNDSVVRWKQTGSAGIPAYILTHKPEGSGRIDRIAFNPEDSSIFYAGSPGGGLWKTTDYGNSYIPLTDELPVTGIADISVCRANPLKIWIATGDAFSNWSYSGGLFYSEDAGSTWQAGGFNSESPDTGFRIFRILLNPQNEFSVFTGNSNGLHCSSDNGNSFIQVTTGEVRDMEWVYNDSSVLIFTSGNPDGTTVICKKNKDLQDIDTVFVPEVNISRIELSVSQGLVYAVLVKENGDLFGVYFSGDEGENWVKSCGSSPNILGWTCEGTGKGAGNSYLSFAVNPADPLELYCGSNYLWKSTDGGKSWHVLSGWCGGNIPYVRPYHRALEFGLDGNVYSGSGGGVFRSVDKGKSWQNISSNLAIMPVIAVSVSSCPGFLVAGTLENGTLRLQNDKWEFIADGDGIYPLALDSLSFLIQVRDALSDKIKLLKTQDGGYNYTICTPKEIKGNIFSPISMYPGINNMLYFSYGPLFQTTDNARSWQILSKPPEPIRFLEQSTIKPDKIYCAGINSVFRSDDGGKNWSIVLDRNSADFTTGTITALQISTIDPNKLWVSFNEREGEGRILESDDGGLNWVDISQGLPSCPVFSLLFESKYQQLFAGTQTGVYSYTPRHGWNRYGSGFPHTRVTSLETDDSKGIIYASTLGRGVWNSNICAPDKFLVPDFIVNTTASCGGSEIVFTESIIPGADHLYWEFGEGANPASASGPGPHKVKYSGTGFRTIRMVANDSFEIIKKNFIEIISEINVALLSDEICSDDTVRLRAFGASIYEWSPGTGVIGELDKSAVGVYPRGVITYRVQGMMGNCKSDDSVVVKIVSDEIDQAFTLTTGRNGPFTNSCATASFSDPVVPTGSVGDGCNSQDGWCRKRSLTNTVWFKLIIPETGNFRIDAPADFNNQIAVFKRTHGSDSMEFLAANDDFFGESGKNAAAVTGITGLTPFDTCWVMVDGGGTGEIGIFYLDLNIYPLVNQLITTETLTVFPNPVRTIAYVSGLLCDYQYKVFTLDGRLIRTSMNPGKNAIDLTGFETGLYLLAINYNNQTIVKLIAKE